MTACRYNRDHDDYLTPDGQPCRHDDHGDPTHHCTARRTCSVHVGSDELTCPRCINRTRNDLAWIVGLAALMPIEALTAGINSEAANLAGPAADPEAWSWRKIAARQGRTWHLSLVEDDDEHHPFSVLGRWDLMLRDAYQQPSTKPTTVLAAAHYIRSQLNRFANDPDQDFALFAREIRTCRAHLEAVLSNGTRPDRGAPCPECTDPQAGTRGPKLVRRYGHWCENPECERVHYDDDRGDRWICPRHPDTHVWDHDVYTKWVTERRQYIRRHGA